MTKQEALQAHQHFQNDQLLNISFQLQFHGRQLSSKVITKQQI